MKTNIAVCATFLCILLSFRVSAQPQRIVEGEVVGVHDGDTITILDANNTQHTIRLSDIDAPELGQDYGTQAKKALSSAVFGKTVKVIVSDRDRYGREIGNVFVDNKSVNLDMVRNGYAWHYKQYSSDSEFAQAEAEARKAKSNVWSRDNAEPPWSYRKTKSDSTDNGGTGYSTSRGATAPEKTATQNQASSGKSTDHSGETLRGDTTAKGQPIYVGPKGGVYHYSASGNKVYEKKGK